MIKKVLFFQSEHTLAKLCHNMGFADELSKKGHDVMFAVSSRGGRFLAANSKYRYQTVPQLWERRPDSHFINTWFRDSEYIKTVFKAELKLMRKEKPDVAVTNVSFTTKLACLVAGIPMISVLPPILSSSKRMFRNLYHKKSLTPEVIKKMHSVTDQWETKWWDSWVEPFSELLTLSGHEPINDIRSLLTGDYQLIHSVPEYDKVNANPEKSKYTGPLIWKGWKHKAGTAAESGNVILCTFGTKVKWESDIIHKTVEAIRMLKSETFVVHTENVNGLKKQYADVSNVQFIESYNAEKILPLCKAVFCQGGYSMVLLCLKYGVPILAVPFHLEQMYHAKKLEQKGVGICLTSMPGIEELSQNNIGGEAFMNGVKKLSPSKIYKGLYEIIENDTFHQKAIAISELINNTVGCRSILKFLDG